MQRFQLPLRSRTMRALAWSALAAVLLLLVNVATSTGVLRAPVPVGNPLISTWSDSPWSTSRVVFAWWLAICTGCYLFLWAMEGNMNVLSGSAPLLLSINGGTLLAATWVTNLRRGSGDPGRRRGRRGDGPAGKFQGHADPGIPDRSYLRGQRHRDLQASIGGLEWLLGIVFIWETLSDWQMPKFNEYLITLLGVSSTAYVGFKASNKGAGGDPAPAQG